MRIRSILFFIIFISFGSNAEQDCNQSLYSEFFKEISGTLQIELSESAKPMKNLPGNLVSTSTAKVQKVSLEGELFVEKTESFRKLTEEELNRVAYNGSKITIRGQSGDLVMHEAPNGEYFTVKELLSAVEATELKTRGNTDWFGGIDVHHIFFEGMECEQGAWTIYWGS